MNVFKKYCPETILCNSLAIIPLGVLSIFVCLLPIFPSLFATAEAAESPARWAITIGAGLPLLLLSSSLAFEAFALMAPRGMVRVVYFDHDELSEVVFGDYPSYTNAKTRVTDEVDLRTSRGDFVAFDDRGRRIGNI